MVSLLRRHRAKPPAEPLAAPAPLGISIVDFDSVFWHDLREEILPVMRPIFEELFLMGAEIGRDVTPVRDAAKALDADQDLINAALAGVLDDYTDRWWSQLEETTRNGLRSAIANAVNEGTGSRGVEAGISGLFSEARVRRIAITETTRLFGLGAQATYAAAGLEKWAWQTVRDPWVCAICAPRQGVIFDIAIPFAPMHPNCRCFPKPVITEPEEAV